MHHFHECVSDTGLTYLCDSDMTQTHTSYDSSFEAYLTHFWVDDVPPTRSIQSIGISGGGRRILPLFGERSPWRGAWYKVRLHDDDLADPIPLPREGMKFTKRDIQISILLQRALNTTNKFNNKKWKLTFFNAPIWESRKIPEAHLSFIYNQVHYLLCKANN